MIATPDNLNSIMEFDHVIQVHEDGTVTDGPPGVYGPELTAISDEDGSHTADTDPDLIRNAQRQGWELQTGWTGQYAYHGPCMHQSEYIGGALAKHILATPGLWVATVIEEDDGEATCWAFAYRSTPTEEIGHDWQTAPITGTTTCARCKLLPIDQDDIDSPCEETP